METSQLDILLAGIENQEQPKFATLLKWLRVPRNIFSIESVVLPSEITKSFWFGLLENHLN